jgi:large subunit ribosomal protein L10
MPNWFGGVLVWRAQGLIFCHSALVQEVTEMPREKKVQAVEKLSEYLAKCSIGILTDYRGLSALEMTALRRKLGELGVEYKVVKNTLAQLAAKKAGREEISVLFQGPVAVAFGYGDIIEPAKALADYISASKSVMSIKGGFLIDRLLKKEEVTALATLPSRQVLLAKVLGGMQGPMFALVGCLSSPIRGVIGVLQARIQQLEG